MATLLYTFLGLTGGLQYCSVRREISPCTCTPHSTFPLNTILITCERMNSFSQVTEALQDKFTTDDNIFLTITYSQLDDLENGKFAKMNLNIKNLRLNYDNLSVIPESTFVGLNKIVFLSLSDNNLDTVPRHIFKHLLNIRTLDLARGRIKKIDYEDFKMLKNLQHLFLVSNQIERIDSGAIPPKMVNLHIGRNNLTSLNGTLRNLNELKLLFVNSNNLTTLDDELPNSENLMMILAQNNRIKNLPQTFKNLPNLDSLHFYNNELRSLDSLLRHATKLQRIFLFNNKIEYLAEDEFEFAENIEDLQLGWNRIKSLNNSLLPIRQLRRANISHNLLEEFSLSEIEGLNVLCIIDLSHNRISKISGSLENLESKKSLLLEMRLEHNLLTSLDSAFLGFSKLQRLTLSYNLLQHISAEDFLGLENLEFLDISHNELRTLEDTSKTLLQSLKVLNASFNMLTVMERDFHGLPVLCLADLSNNMISEISPNLVAHTRCNNHGVANKFEIILQENPVLCDDYLPELIAAMEVQQARLLGVAHCIVPQQIPIDHSVLLQPPIPLLSKIIQPQIPLLANDPIMHPPPSIVQVIVPAPLLTSGQQPILHLQQQQQHSQLINQQILTTMPSMLTTPTSVITDQYPKTNIIPETTTVNSKTEDIVSESPNTIVSLPEKTKGIHLVPEEPPEDVPQKSFTTE